ncbi:MAG: DUF4065 domain-containing protein [Catonella sp.]|nr:DUF4065 domain-containing protein [Catonella sp.]MDY6355664.1 DUF4065 domain-containing protein [Catonella sp.]
MADTTLVAKVLYDTCGALYGRPPEEARMQKLMYFAQREYLIRNSRALFNESFRAFAGGPVLLSVRAAYDFDHSAPFAFADGVLSPSEMDTVIAVAKGYGRMATSRLNEIIHTEYSWKNARTGISPYLDSYNRIKLASIQRDAAREAVAREYENKVNWKFA